MKKNKTIFMFPSIFIFICVALYPIFKIMVDVKEFENVYFSLGTIIGLLFFILLCIAVFVELIYFIYFLFTKSDLKILYKLLWTVLLVVFNILIIPYFYMKYVSKEDKILYKSILYLLPIIMSVGVFMFGYNTYTKQFNKIKAERKRIEEERNVYNTKDNQVSFTFRHGYKNSEVGEYDLYVINKQKNVVFTAFTYDITLYEQRSVDDYLNKGIQDIQAGKEKFSIYKEKEVLDREDKVITTVEYKGKTKESTMCIYKISVISYKNKPDYLVYVVEVVTKNNYDLYKKEMLEILDSSKIN